MFSKQFISFLLLYSIVLSTNAALHGIQEMHIEEPLDFYMINDDEEKCSVASSPPTPDASPQHYKKILDGDTMTY